MEGLLEYGYWGLFFGTFLAATIVPFASDALLVGILIAGGDPVLSVIIATSGNWLGGLTSYWVGYSGRWEWIEKWFKVKHETIERQRERIAKYGPIIALLSWLPIVGDVLAVALGFYHINFWKTSVYMLIGKCARYILWVYLYGLIKFD